MICSRESHWSDCSWIVLKLNNSSDTLFIFFMLTIINYLIFAAASEFIFVCCCQQSSAAIKPLISVFTWFPTMTGTTIQVLITSLNTSFTRFMDNHQRAFLLKEAPYHATATNTSKFDALHKSASTEYLLLHKDGRYFKAPVSDADGFVLLIRIWCTYWLLVRIGLDKVPDLLVNTQSWYIDSKIDSTTCLPFGALLSPERPWIA